MSERLRSDLEAIQRLPIALPAAVAAAATGAIPATGVTPAGGGSNRVSFIPLSEVATLAIAPGPNQVSREQGKRRIVVSANVRGRDLGSFVAEAGAAIEQQVIVAGSLVIA